jgi:predicted tellurium resistance membrane protein TerC
MIGGVAMARRQSVTSLELSPDEERKQRMIKYSIAMTIRTICIILGVITPGIWMWIFFALAIFLPYFAVVLANAQGPTRSRASSAVAPKLSIRASEIRIDDAK